MNYLFYTVVVLAMGLGAAVANIPSVCLTSPAMIMQAGSQISATIDSFCEATLRFTDEAFLPIQFSFESMTCLGHQVAEFTVPAWVPNGDAFLLWYCAGQDSPTCNRVIISAGQGDPTAQQPPPPGTIGCVVTSVTTMSTLSTVTSSSGTFIETLLSTSSTIFTSFGPSAATIDIPTAAVTNAPSDIGIPAATTTNVAGTNNIVGLSNTGLTNWNATVTGAAANTNMQATNNIGDLSSTILTNWNATSSLLTGQTGVNPTNSLNSPTFATGAAAVGSASSVCHTITTMVQYVTSTALVPCGGSI